MSANRESAPLVRLPGSSGGLISRYRVLAGDDHLVLVQRNGYREVYRRVEFDDIQASAMQRTSSYAAWAAGGAVTIALLTLLAIASDGAPRIVWATFAVLALIPLAVHLLRGPSCRVYLRTPLDWLEVPAWRRQRPARRALERLERAVSGRQGELSPAEARARLGEVVPVLAEPEDVLAPLPAGPGVPPSAAGARRAAGTATAGSATSGRWQRALVALLGAGLLVWGAMMVAPDAPIGTAAAVLVLAQIIAAIGALSAGAEPRLRRWTLMVLVTVSLVCMIGFYVATIIGMVGGTPSPSPFAPASLPGRMRQPLGLILTVLTSLLLAARWRIRSRPSAE